MQGGLRRRSAKISESAVVKCVLVGASFIILLKAGHSRSILKLPEKVPLGHTPPPRGEKFSKLDVPQCCLQHRKLQVDEQVRHDGRRWLGSRSPAERKRSQTFLVIY